VLSLKAAHKILPAYLFYAHPCLVLLSPAY